MKKLISLSTVIVLFLCLLSCSKDNPAPVAALVTTPEADAAEDNLSGGVYKGSFIGSSGVIKATLQKGKIEILLTLDKVTRTLTTTSLASWKSGQAIAGAIFTSGDWSVTLSVSADGSSPVIVFSIPGHPTITIALLKEKSTALIKGFEGTYAGSETGTWNLLIRGNYLLGVSRSTDGKNGGLFAGTADGNNLNIPGAGAVGTINGDVVSGTWQGQPADFKGTWTGKRTL